MNIAEANLLQGSMRDLTAAIIARKRLDQDAQDRQLQRQAAESLARQKSSELDLRERTLAETVRHNRAMEGRPVAGAGTAAKINGTLRVSDGGNEMTMGISGDPDTVSGFIEKIKAERPQAKVEMFDKLPEKQVFPVNLTTQNGQQVRIDFTNKEEALAFVDQADKLYKKQPTQTVKGVGPGGLETSATGTPDQLSGIVPGLKPPPPEQPKKTIESLTSPTSKEVVSGPASEVDAITDASKRQEAEKLEAMVASGQPLSREQTDWLLQYRADVQRAAKNAPQTGMQPVLNPPGIEFGIAPPQVQPPAVGLTGTQKPAASTIPTIRTADEYAKLKSGDTFIDARDGKKKRKP